MRFETGPMRGSVLAERGAEELVYVGVNADDFAVALFAAAWAGIPLVPLNYRLSRDALEGLLSQHPNALVISDVQLPTRAHAVTVGRWRAACAERSDNRRRGLTIPKLSRCCCTPVGPRLEPKAAVLRHRHLTSYLLGSIDFGAAGEQEAVIVSVPPYHIAGVSNLLSNICSGRRVVYLEAFTAHGWLDCVRAEAITHALLVPTMLAKITEHLDQATNADVPTLKSLAYGGAKMPIPVLERAIRLFPGVDFVNAYGLTETSSTIAVLGPDDHRAALERRSGRTRQARLGRSAPSGIEVEIRGPGGALPTGTAGDIYVRGDQVSGEYRGAGSVLDGNGWFATRDRGWVDEDGYLFVEGRTDDTIIRGGENIAPAEIEDVLLEHSAVVEAAVVGVPDEHWGQEIAAAVVLRPGRIVHAEELREWVRSRLRGSKTPTLIAIRDALPQTATGKVLRRELLADLLATHLQRSPTLQRKRQQCLTRSSSPPLERQSAGPARDP